MKFQIIPQPWGVGLETTICQKYQMWYLWSLQTLSGPADSLKTETIRVSGHILDLYYVWLLSAVPFYENGRNKGKLAGQFFLLFWENDRAAITIISWGFGGCCEPLRIFIVFPHENVLNKNQLERNKSRKYTSSSQWSRLLLDFQQ